MNRTSPVSGSKRTTKCSLAWPKPCSEPVEEGTTSRAVSSSTGSQRTRGSVRKTEGIERVSAHMPRLAAWLALGALSTVPQGISWRLLPSR